MRKRIGTAMMLAGLVLFFQPNFDIEQMIYYIQFLCDKYWPLLLVIVGVYLQNFQLYHKSHVTRKKSLQRR